MASLEEIRATRLEKVEILRKNGMDPYPAKAERTFSVGEAEKNFDRIAGEKKSVTLAGRVMSVRAQGALIFFHFFDGTGKFQGLLKKPETESEFTKVFDLFMQTVDVGDFLEVTGIPFLTKRGERTLEVSGWKMLTKSLLPLPEK